MRVRGCGEPADDVARRLDAEYRNLDRAVAWVANADNKALIALSFQGVVVVGLATVAEFVRAEINVQPAASRSWLTVLLIAFIVFLVLSIFSAFRALFPIVSLGRPTGGGGSLFFFETVAAMPHDEFAARMRQLDIAGIESELIAQTHANAQVASRKFKRVKAVVIYLTIEVVCLVAATLIVLVTRLLLQRYLSPEAVLTTWKQAYNRSVYRGDGPFV